MKIKFILVPLLLLSFGFYQVEQLKPDPAKIGFTPLMHKVIEERVASYIQIRKEKCLEKIVQDAETFVDSVIINEINIKLLDTIIFPEKPIKPNFPEKIVLDDTTLIKK